MRDAGCAGRCDRRPHREWEAKFGNHWPNRSGRHLRLRCSVAVVGAGTLGRNQCSRPLVGSFSGRARASAQAGNFCSLTIERTALCPWYSRKRIFALCNWPKGRFARAWNCFWRTGVGEGAVDRLIIAGAFGKFLDVNAALAIGLLPPAFAGRIVQVGNAAGAGVRRLLVCRSAREKARSLALKAQYLELATQPGFRATFARRAAF